MIARLLLALLLALPAYAQGPTPPAAMLGNASLPQSMSGRVCMIGDSITAAGTQPFTIGLTGSGGTGPYTWQITNAPTGLGTTSGASAFYIYPSTTYVGAYQISITVTDNVAATGTQAYNLTIGANSIPTLTPVGQSTGTLTQTMSLFLQGESSRGPGFWLGFLTSQRAKAPVALVSSQPGAVTNEIVSRLPDIVHSNCGSYVVLIGTNDLGTFTNDVIIANLTRIYETLLATGRPVILQTLLPRTLTAAGANQMQLWYLNRWLRNLHGTIPNLYIVDGGLTYGDPLSTTSTPVTGAGGVTALDYSYDGLHPKVRGAYHAFKPVADLYNQLVPPVGAAVSGISDAYNVTTNPTGNLLPNGLMTTTGGTGTVSGGKVSGTVPDGWVGLSIDNGCSPCTFTGVASSVTLTDGTPAAQMVLGGTSSGGTDTRIQFRYSFAAFTNFAAGDKLQASCRFELDAGATHVAGPFMQLVATSASKTYQYAAGDVGSGNTYLFADHTPTVALAGILRTPDPITPLPAAPTLLQLAIGMHVTNTASGTVAGTFRIAACSLRKVA